MKKRSNIMTSKNKDEPKVILPPANMLVEMSKYFLRLKNTRPLLNLYPADVKISASVRKCAGVWLGKDQHILSNHHIDDFLRQLFESLADKDVDETAILTDIKKNAGVGYVGGGVSGKNEYSKDKSRVDGRMIQRKRR